MAADSLRSLNLSEATVITFMMPLVASYGGYLLLGSPVTWVEILLSALSLLGVVLVASPDALFPASESDTTPGNIASVSSMERVWALCVGLVGVCGSAAAFLSMSAIGKTEDPLTVVNYFAAMCTVVSGVSLIVLPGLGFQAPGDIWEWTLLFFSGLSGFLMVGHRLPVQTSFCVHTRVLTLNTTAITHYPVIAGGKVPGCGQHGVHADRICSRSRRHRFSRNPARCIAVGMCDDLRVCGLPGVAQDEGKTKRWKPRRSPPTAMKFEWWHIVYQDMTCLVHKPSGFFSSIRSYPRARRQPRHALPHTHHAHRPKPTSANTCSRRPRVGNT